MPLVRGRELFQIFVIGKLRERAIFDAVRERKQEEDEKRIEVGLVRSAGINLLFFFLHR